MTLKVEGQSSGSWGRDISKIRQGKLRSVVWARNGRVVWRKGEVVVYRKATEKVKFETLCRTFRSVAKQN